LELKSDKKTHTMSINQQVLPRGQVTMRVTSKGQVTIPKPVRDRRPGTQVEFELAADGRAFLGRVGKGKMKPSRFARMRGTATSGLTTDEIMQLTRDGA
jgi:AbrB family looped-hinge helix DNA binding protein